MTLIRSASYGNLSQCAKFALNDCLDQDGNRTEPNCGPDRKWQHWEDYRDVASARGCNNAECLCKQPYFDATFAVAFDAGERYCGMWISYDAQPNEDYEAMQNVLAMYCAAANYPPKEWWLRLTGLPPGSNQLNQSNHSDQTNGSITININGGTPNSTAEPNQGGKIP